MTPLPFEVRGYTLDPDIPSKYDITFSLALLAFLLQASDPRVSLARVLLA